MVLENADEQVRMGWMNCKSCETVRFVLCIDALLLFQNPQGLPGKHTRSDRLRFSLPLSHTVYPPIRDLREVDKTVIHNRRCASVLMYPGSGVPTLSEDILPSMCVNNDVSTCFRRSALDIIDG
jgi:hypothetical protein